MPRAKSKGKPTPDYVVLEWVEDGAAYQLWGDGTFAKRDGGVWRITTTPRGVDKLLAQMCNAIYKLASPLEAYMLGTAERGDEVAAELALNLWIVKKVRDC